MKLYIGVPMRDNPTAHFSASIANFLVGLTAKNEHVFGYDPPRNVSNLALMRNLILHRALEQDFDRLLFIDDDIHFREDQAMKVIEAVGEGREVVGACYRKKKEAVEHAGYPLETCGLPPATDGLFVGAACLGMGLTCIDLGFIRKMLSWKTSIPKFTYKGEKNPVAALFEFKVDEDLSGETRFLGEDEVFCKHVVKAGGKVWFHRGALVGHVGAYVYR